MEVSGHFHIYRFTTWKEFAVQFRHEAG